MGSILHVLQTRPEVWDALFSAVSPLVLATPRPYVDALRNYFESDRYHKDLHLGNLSPVPFECVAHAIGPGGTWEVSVSALFSHRGDLVNDVVNALWDLVDHVCEDGGFHPGTALTPQRVGAGNPSAARKTLDLVH